MVNTFSAALVAISLLAVAQPASAQANEKTSGEQSNSTKPDKYDVDAKSLIKAVRTEHMKAKTKLAAEAAAAKKPQ